MQPEKLDQLASTLEGAGAPVFLGGMARGLLGADSSVQCRHARGKELVLIDHNFISSKRKISFPVNIEPLSRCICFEIFFILGEPDKALKKADLIILAGVSADFRLNYGRR